MGGLLRPPAALLAARHRPPARPDRADRGGARGGRGRHQLRRPRRSRRRPRAPRQGAPARERVLDEPGREFGPRRSCSRWGRASAFARQAPTATFVLPDGGAESWIDAWAVTPATARPHTAHAFVNHQLSPAAQARDWTFSKTPAAVPAAARLVPAGLRTDPLTRLGAGVGNGFTPSLLSPVGLPSAPRSGRRSGRAGILAARAALQRARAGRRLPRARGGAAGDDRRPRHDARPGARRHPHVDVRLRRGRAHRRAAPGAGDDLQERRRRARPRRRQDGRPRRSAHATRRSSCSGRWGGSSTRSAAATWRPRTSARRTADAEIVALETRPHHRPPGRAGRLRAIPSPMTAWGVFCGMRAAIGRGRARRRPSAGVRVAVQGAGHVGGGLVRHLLEAGAVVTVADIYPDRVEPLVALGATACAARDGARAGVRRVTRPARSAP